MSNRKPIEVGQTVTVTGVVEAVEVGDGVPGSDALLVTVHIPRSTPAENRPTSTPRANRPEATT